MIKYVSLKNLLKLMEKSNLVRNLRKESYWYNEVGTIVTVEKRGKYPILVRFNKVNYSGTNSTNFNSKELQLVIPEAEEIKKQLEEAGAKVSLK
jgi:photosystem I subunit 4